MQWLKQNSGWVIVFFLCLTTAVLWYLAGLDGLLITSLSQITGLIGLTLFSISLILSGRFRFTEALFGGMNRVYIAHHLIGGIAFILLLAHPLLVAGAFVPISLKRAALQLLPSANWAQNLGIAGLLILMSLLIFTYYVNIPYQIWRLTHKFLGLAFFLGGIHSLFIPSTISRFAPLRYYLLALGGSALGVYLYRTVLGRFLVRRWAYVVESVKNVGNQTIEMLLYPAASPLPYAPGQFLFIGFPRNPVLKEVHPFSISSAPSERKLRVSAKALGDYTTRLLELKPGDVAEIEGPYGRFSYLNYLNKYQVWVAGGIGVTPFLSMAADLKPDYFVRLYYCVKEGTEAVYLHHLQSLEPLKPGLKVIPWFSAAQGRISAETLARDLTGEVKKYEFFICGPPPMMKNLRAGLNRLGVSHYHIHTEEFNIN